MDSQTALLLSPTDSITSSSVDEDETTTRRLDAIRITTTSRISKKPTKNKKKKIIVKKQIRKTTAAAASTTTDISSTMTMTTMTTNPPLTNTTTPPPTTTTTTVAASSSRSSSRYYRGNDNGNEDSNGNYNHNLKHQQRQHQSSHTTTSKFHHRTTTRQQHPTRRGRAAVSLSLQQRHVPMTTCKIFLPFVIACGYVLFISNKLLNSTQNTNTKHVEGGGGIFDYQSFLPSSLVSSYGAGAGGTTATNSKKRNAGWITSNSNNGNTYYSHSQQQEQQFNYKINEKNENNVRQVPYLQYHVKKKQSVPTLLPKPIINVGFPKSGTSSIFEFFRCNGLIGQHWYCCEPQTHHAIVQNYYLMSTCILRNLANNLPILHDCGHNVGGGQSDGTATTGDNDSDSETDSYVDVYSEINGPRKLYKQGKLKGELLDDGTLADDTVSISPRILFPQHHYLNKIHDQYPNSTFILHTRPVQDWVKSVMNWDSELKWELPNEFYSQQQQQSQSQQNTKDNGDEKQQHQHLRNSNNWASEFSPIKVNITLPTSIEELPTFLTWLYDYHTQFIKHFVKVYPSHALVEIDITNNDTGTILGTSFGLDPTCWKQMNKAPPPPPSLLLPKLPMNNNTTNNNNNTDNNHAEQQQPSLGNNNNNNSNSNTVFPISGHIRRPTIPRLRHHELDRSHDFKKQQEKSVHDVNKNTEKQTHGNWNHDSNTMTVDNSSDAYDIRTQKRLQRINDMEQALEERRRIRDNVRSAKKERGGFLRTHNTTTTSIMNATTTTAVLSKSSKTTAPPSIVVTNTTTTPTTSTNTTTLIASTNTTNTTTTNATSAASNVSSKRA